MNWRVAFSLDELLLQLNQMYPHRSKVSDGSIGDAAHALRTSDHNPWYGPGIVTARDFTHDPDGGIDGHKLSAQLTTSGDRRIKYVIWNYRIWEPGVGWQAYHGSNAHTHHVHVSVVASKLCDDRTPWKLGTAGSPVLTVLKQGMSGPAVKRMQDLLWVRVTPDRLKPFIQNKFKLDGVFGEQTAKLVKVFGEQVGINNSGQYGSRTRGWLDPPLLKRGSSGNAVEFVQVVYNQRIGTKLTRDGDYGPNTEKATVSYQKSQKIPGGGGQVGYRTWNAIHRGSYIVK